MKSAIALFIAVISMAGLVSAQCPVNANNSGADLTINGSTAFAGQVGDAAIINFSSDAAGNPFDIGIDAAVAAVCTPLADDSVELDLATASSLFGGSVAANMPTVGFGIGGAGTSSLNIAVAAVAGTYVLQAGAIDATDPDGVSMSEVCTYNVQACVANVIPLGDDGSVNVALCNPVTFYGTSYSSVEICSNGWLQFGGTTGANDFSFTVAEWQAGDARVGWGTDLQPNQYGTVTATETATGIVVDYTDMAEWGTSGANTVSYSIEVSSSVGAAITGMTIGMGTFGSAVGGGITAGAAGTHPATVSFDALSGMGPQMGAATTDSWIDDTGAGSLPIGFGSTVNNIIFAGADGSSADVN